VVGGPRTMLALGAGCWRPPHGRTLLTPAGDEYAARSTEVSAQGGGRRRLRWEMIDLRVGDDDVRRRMDQFRGALLPVVCALLQTVAVGTGLPDRSPGAAAAASLIGAASGLVLLARDRAPFVVLAATVIGYHAQVLVGGPALPVAVSVMVFLVARGYSTEGLPPVHSPTSTAVALLGGLGGVVAPLLMTGLGFEAALYGLLCSVSGAAGLLLALRSGRDQQRRNELVMAERLRIARELHDIVGHGMGAITVQAGAARMAVTAGALDDATRSLLDIEAAGRGVLREVRWLVTLLREEGHHALPDIPDLVDDARRSGLDVALDVEGDVAAVPAAVGEAAYRIVQEALTNVLRHSHRKMATVSIRVTEAVALDILDRDDAVEARTVAEGNGMRGMRERAAAAGGVLSAGPGPDGNWSVHAELPLGRSR
jgi:signal transduction histidine kinase